MSAHMIIIILNVNSIPDATEQRSTMVLQSSDILVTENSTIPSVNNTDKLEFEGTSTTEQLQTFTEMYNTYSSNYNGLGWRILYHTFNISHLSIEQYTSWTTGMTIF